jgi:hypothetical protein
MSYGPDFADSFREAGGLTGKILKGAKPADAAIEAARVRDGHTPKGRNASWFSIGEGIPR